VNVIKPICQPAKIIVVKPDKIIVAEQQMAIYRALKVNQAPGGISKTIV